jgi:hypothetical protein
MYILLSIPSGTIHWCPNPLEQHLSGPEQSLSDWHPSSNKVTFQLKASEQLPGFDAVNITTLK